MFLGMSKLGISTKTVLAAGAVLGLAGSSLAAGPDVSISIRVGGWNAPSHVTPRPAPVRSTAGVLTIDGRSFHIDADRSVRRQIKDAFECMGYHAWYVGRSVRVETGHCGPEVCWSNGEYTLAFRERRNSVTLTPMDSCDAHYHGHSYRYGFDRAHGRYMSYTGVTVNNSTSWVAAGFTAFVDSDRDLDDEIGKGGRENDAGRARYQPDERRHDRGNDAVKRVTTGENRSTDTKNVDTSKRTESRQPVVTAKPVKTPTTTAPSDLKRTTAATRDTSRALPADRLGDLKRDDTSKLRMETKTSTSTIRQTEAKQTRSDSQSKPGRSQPSVTNTNDKKSKW